MKQTKSNKMKTLKIILLLVIAFVIALCVIPAKRPIAFIDNPEMTKAYINTHTQEQVDSLIAISH
jgi:hypothetical protein